MTNVINLSQHINNSVTENYKGQQAQMFSVDTLPLSSPRGEIKEKKGLFVGDDCINIVSNRYEVHQPMDVLNTFENVAHRTNLEVNRILTNPKNGGLLISARYAQTQIAGEDHDVNLVFYTSHCGKYKTFLTLNLLRMACMNQVPCLYKAKDRFIFAEKHYQNALDISLIEGILEGIPESVEHYNNIANVLMDAKLSEKQFVEFYVDHYKLDKEQKQFDSKVAKARNVYHNATGQRDIPDGTGYKALQAITFINTHEGKNTAMREENSLIKGGADSLSVMDKLVEAA